MRHPATAAALGPDGGRIQNPSSARIGAIRRAARARCEIRFFSSADHSPSVRPPTGSWAGSKIGSYPNPPVPRATVAIRPRHVPRAVRIATLPSGPGTASARTQTYRAPRRSAGSPSSAASSLRLLARPSGARRRSASSARRGRRRARRPRGRSRRRRPADPSAARMPEPSVGRSCRTSRPSPGRRRRSRGRPARPARRAGGMEQLAQLADLVPRPGRDDEPRPVNRLAHRRTVAIASAWSAKSRWRPTPARSSRWSTPARSNGLPSAVPCSSTYVPASVPTTLKSTSAFESSE